jgi:hypothetical protein
MPRKKQSAKQGALDPEKQKAGKAALDQEAVQLMMKLVQLKKESNAVNKKLGKVVKNRIELYGDTDMQNIDINALVQEAEDDKDAEKD